MSAPRSGCTRPGLRCLVSLPPASRFCSGPLRGGGRRWAAVEGESREEEEEEEKEEKEEEDEEEDGAGGR